FISNSRSLTPIPIKIEDLLPLEIKPLNSTRGCTPRTSLKPIHCLVNSSTNERSTYGTTIQSVQDFITETIDGWHYPTLVDT
ncbi:hypothetical protein HPQ58_00105, partial [Vibrio parahaemolyticus]|nr:hypothetical protein [Vibrio parahaemolyticus]